MRSALRHEIYQLIVGDSTIKQLMGGRVDLYYRMAKRNPPFPYLVHICNFHSVSPSDTVFRADWTIDIWDFNADGTRVEEVANALIALMDRRYLDIPGGGGIGIRLFWEDTLDASVESEQIQRLSLRFTIRGTDVTLNAAIVARGEEK